MGNFKSVEEAKASLTENGFYTGNLWCVEDVQAKFECTDEEALDVLDGHYRMKLQWSRFGLLLISMEKTRV